MNLLAADIVERFYTFLWPMLRISALMMSAPIFSLRALNVRMRVLLAAALTWMVYPLYTWPALDPVSGAGMVEVFNQISIGLIMGLSLQVITAAIVLAGQSVSTAMGLSIASLIDPNFGNIPLISQFLL
jgi:flagellar biosynthetic protein FliR